MAFSRRRWVIFTRAFRPLYYPCGKMGTTHSLFLLRHLLAVKRFLLNKEHSRPFEQCWPLRDHLVLCESSSALQTFYHMKNN